MLKTSEIFASCLVCVVVAVLHIKANARCSWLFSVHCVLLILIVVGLCVRYS